MTDSASTTPAGSARATRPRVPAESPTGARTLGRIKNRRKAGPLHKVGMVVFTLGLLAIAVDAAMFATGLRDMPWWLHALTVLAPLGLAIGLAGAMAEARRHRDT